MRLGIMNVTGRRRHVRPFKVYIFSISATRKIDVAMSVSLSIRSSLCNVQTTFLGDLKSYKLQIFYVRTERYWTGVPVPTNGHPNVRLKNRLQSGW